VPGLIMRWENWHSLLTSMFMHGGWAHIIGNMLFLYVFWDNIEARLGHVKFVIFYLLTWLVGSLAHVFTDVSSMIPSLGASGAISWILGAYLILFPSGRVKMRDPRFGGTYFIGASTFLLYWIGIQLFSGFGSLATSWEGGWTARFAHIWWFAAGWLWAKMQWGKYKGDGRKWPQILDIDKSPFSL
jgi:membrane associated rhomboid family serine protease